MKEARSAVTAGIPWIVRIVMITVRKERSSAVTADAVYAMMSYTRLVRTGVFRPYL